MALKFDNHKISIIPPFCSTVRAIFAYGPILAVKDEGPIDQPFACLHDEYRMIGQSSTSYTPGVCNQANCPDESPRGAITCT